MHGVHESTKELIGERDDCLLSKSERKAARRVFQNQRRTALRAERRRERKQKEHTALVAKMHELADPDRMAEIRRLRDIKKMEREKFRDYLQKCYDSGFTRIVINCSFCHAMDDVELASLVTQVQLSYSYLKRLSFAPPLQPPQLRITSLDPQSRLVERMKIQGCESWIMHLHEEPFWEIFKAESHKVVCLTPDASEELSEVIAGNIYVVGGLVDKTIAKSQSLHQANQFEFECRKLPVRGIVRNPVLNVDTVVNILLTALQRPTDAIRDIVYECVPPRKREDTLTRKTARLEKKEETRLALFNGVDPLKPNAVTNEYHNAVASGVDEE